MPNEPSPRPWRVVENSLGWKSCIDDADGKRIASCWGGDGVNCTEPAQSDAALIVDAVNNADSWRSACIKARTERNAFLLERDRLRDLVGRLAQRIQFARLADPNPGGEDPLLREAAAVCKNAREEK